MQIIEMQLCLHEQNTKVIPVYIRSTQHLHADLISRNKVMPDWHLDRAIAQKIFKLLDQPATSKSRQVDVYFAALEDDKANALDAFSEDWSRFRLAYIFPPPVMMELILNRIYQCLGESRFIVICPWKLRALWFPKPSSNHPGFRPAGPR